MVLLESEASCIFFFVMKAKLHEKVIMKVSLHSYANKTNFHMESFVHSLAFITRFKATRKWPIVSLLS